MDSSFFDDFIELMEKKIKITIKEKLMKQKSVIIIAVFFVFMLQALIKINCQTVIIKDKSFKTPEEAILHFIDAIKKNDLSLAFEACAINETAQNFDFLGFVERLKAIIFITFMAPANDPMLVEINRINKLFFISNQIKFMIYNLTTDEKDFGTVVEYTSGRLDNFLKSLDPKKLSGLNIIRIDKPNLVDNDRYLGNALKEAKIYGAKNATERIALIEFNKKLYVFGAHLFLYNGSWKIDSLVSPLANTPIIGIRQVTMYEYSEMTVSDDEE